MKQEGHQNTPSRLPIVCTWLEIDAPELCAYGCLSPGLRAHFCLETAEFVNNARCTP